MKRSRAVSLPVFLRHFKLAKESSSSWSFSAWVIKPLSYTVHVKSRSCWEVKQKARNFFLNFFITPGSVDMASFPNHNNRLPITAGKKKKKKTPPKTWLCAAGRSVPKHNWIQCRFQRDTECWLRCKNIWSTDSKEGFYCFWNTPTMWPAFGLAMFQSFYLNQPLLLTSQNSFITESN